MVSILSARSGLAWAGLDLLIRGRLALHHLLMGGSASGWILTSFSSPFSAMILITRGVS
jgi:hypothetical protein